MDCGLLAEDSLEARGVGGRDLASVEGAEALLQLERSCERRRHGHLLIEGEADQESERVARDERVRLRVAREVEGCGHDPIVDGPCPLSQRVRQPAMDRLSRLLDFPPSRSVT